MSMLILLLGLGLSMADEDAGPALAVPVNPSPAQPPPPPPTSSAPLAIPGGSPPQGPPAADRLQALRQYQRQRLAINPEFAISGGGTRVYSSFGFGYGFPGFGTGVVITDPIQTHRTHGVYQGSTWLDVPTFLQVAGADDLQRDVSRDISRARRRSRACYITAGVGVLGMIVGSAGARSAENRNEYRQYASLVGPSLGLTVGGLFVGSFPAARSERMRRYPAESIGLDRAQQIADEYNNNLRMSLGLTPEEVWPIEAQPTPVR